MTRKTLPTGRILVVIDAANFARQVDYFEGRHLSFDFEVLRNLLNRLGPIVEFSYFTARNTEDVGVDDFLTKLYHLGYRIRHFSTRVFANGQMKGDLDHEIIVEVFDRLDDFETLLLISADGDYTSFVKLLMRRGKKVIVLAHSKAIAQDLRKSGGEFLPLDQLVKQAPELLMHRLPAKIREMP